MNKESYKKIAEIASEYVHGTQYPKLFSDVPIEIFTSDYCVDCNHTYVGDECDKCALKELMGDICDN